MNGRSRARAIRRVALPVLLAAALLTSSGCADAATVSNGASGSRGAHDWESTPGDWADFGPLRKPAMFAEQVGLPGPADVLVPGLGAVRLDASEMLPGERIETEVYTVTLAEDRPIVGGIVQVREPAEGELPERLVTRVLGIDVGAAGEEATAGIAVPLPSGPPPRILSRTDIFSGVDHVSSLAGSSDLGVIAVELEGDLQPESGVSRRIVGVDVARGTEVWFREHGEPRYGYGELEYESVDGGSCAEVETLDVASGRVLRTAGGSCE